MLLWPCRQLKGWFIQTSNTFTPRGWGGCVCLDSNYLATQSNKHILCHNLLISGTFITIICVIKHTKMLHMWSNQSQEAQFVLVTSYWVGPNYFRQFWEDFLSPSQKTMALRLKSCAMPKGEFLSFVKSN